jgi:hypothetical protein
MMDFILMLFFAGMMSAFLFVFIVIARYSLWATIKDDKVPNEPEDEPKIR